MPRPRLPLVLGTDGAGLVVAAGSGVDRLKVGDRAYAYSFANPKGGFYAEYVALAAGRAAHPPALLDLAQAGAIATTGLTALQGVDDALHVKPGEAVVVHGASGGVGTLAVQFAKLRGARVFATASGEDGVAVVRRRRGSGLRRTRPRRGTRRPRIRAGRRRCGPRLRRRREAGPARRATAQRRPAGLPERGDRGHA